MKTKNKTQSKEQKQIDESQNKAKISCISLANKMRQSGPGPTSRFSAKYIFKSTKKAMTQEIV